MAKRPAEQEEERGPRKDNQKRQKTSPPEQIEEIFSARQLQDLLAFRQDDIDRLRNGAKEIPSICTCPLIWPRRCRESESVPRQHSIQPR